MLYPDQIRAGLSRVRAVSGALLLACAILPAAAAARQTPMPPAAAPETSAPQGAPRTAPAAPAAPAAPRAPAQVAPRAPAQPAATRAAAAPPAPVVPPREVVTVVHRMSGWKLLAWLAASGGPVLELDEFPSAADAHTNIVAGYIYDDGRSVVARLPQAEVEVEAFSVPPAPPAFFGGGATPAAARAPEPEYTLVTADGRHVEAKFVGLDSSTGLTLLEAKDRLLPAGPAGAEGDTEDPTVGQRVRLYAPAPAPGSRAAPQATPGFIFLSIEQKDGLLTQVSRGASDRPSRVVARADVSPQWTGAVAANELGEVVGIVSQTRAGEAQIVPMAVVREACDRVLKLRGSVPQVWLGARAEAASQSRLDAWVGLGWPRETAGPLIERRQGVLLNSVVPGSPAAQAGLRPGDLIAGVGPREVRNIEDFSKNLREATVGSTLDLTVWRALRSEPFKVSVELKGVNNPALATAYAEQSAAFERVAALAREVSRAEDELRGVTVPTSTPAERAQAEALRARLRELQLELKSGTEQMREAAERAAVARRRPFGGVDVLPRLKGPFDLAAPLQSLGLSTVGLTPRGAARFGAQGGLLVVNVRPETPAAASSLRAGDVIETVNSAPLDRAELLRLLVAPEAAPLSLGIVREGRRLIVSFTPAAGAAPRR
ncbi:MAG TPA: PDZ domain-containing protein [Pyrinomonadaceae bacterium]|jgi:S1-C subfamily serine protease